MRKRLLLVLGILLCVGLTAPAQADLMVSNTGSANAFWYTTQKVSDTQYRVTTWYVGVYDSRDGSWADVYREVALCKHDIRPEPAVEHEEEPCTLESLAFGAKNIEDGEFTMDRLLLRRAKLEADFPVQAVDAEGNPIGDPVDTHVVTEWTGIDKAYRDRGVSLYSGGCSVYGGTFLGAYRPADAVASVGGADLGGTADAYLGHWLSADVYQGC